MDDADSAVLDSVATSLLAVAYADPDRTEPEVRLACLWASELLSSVGALPTPPSNGQHLDIRECILDALTLLGLLPIEVFSLHAVLEAAAAARVAFDAA